MPAFFLLSNDFLSIPVYPLPSLPYPVFLFLSPSPSFPLPFLLLPQMSQPARVQICGRVMSLPRPSCPVAVLSPPLLWGRAPPPQPSPSLSAAFPPTTAVSLAEYERKTKRKKDACSGTPHCNAHMYIVGYCDAYSSFLRSHLHSCMPWSMTQRF